MSGGNVATVVYIVETECYNGIEPLVEGVVNVVKAMLSCFCVCVLMVPYVLYLKKTNT